MDPIEVNQLTFSVQFNFMNNQREVACALVDQDRRKISVIEFADNEHYSTFESILVQANPMQAQDAKFQVLCLPPELTPEREKINDLFSQCDFEVITKEKKDFIQPQLFERDMDVILIRPLRQFVQESAGSRSMACVQAILSHLNLVRDASNAAKFTLEFMSLNNYLKLDLAAINALMIFPKAGLEQRFAQLENSSMTLVDYLNRCKTAMGTRCLRRWVKMPLQDADQINRRLNIVEFLVVNPQFRQYLQEEYLRKIPDLDKLYAKFYKVHSQKRHNASLNDCIKVYQLVVNMRNLVSNVSKQKPHLKNPVDDVVSVIFLEPFVEVLEDFKKFEEMIERSIDLQKAYQGEFVVNPKFSPKLMDINKHMQKALSAIEQVRQNVSEDLGIDITLQESGNYTFVFEANKKTADEAFRRKGGQKYKTLTVKKGQITFTLEELQGEVAEYNHLNEEYLKEQEEVVSKILGIVSGYYPAMEVASQCISEIGKEYKQKFLYQDVYCSFAKVVDEASRKFVKPIININNKLILKDSRHPLLEVVDLNCIVNDLEMDRNLSRLHIITGPNMGGKSTFIRQVAICALMAHIGCFVPCSYAQVPIMDAIITRVGASDMQLRGISTFMSEMLEASCMLKTATPKSLIIIDELGRGTSTSEGFGIAWAIAEHIAEKLHSWCLFATHFHEMTMMENEIKGVKNYFVSCLTNDNTITMQYKVKQGAVDRSYGLLVAQMLKFPKEVLDDAKQKSEELEKFNVQVDQEDKENYSNIEEELIFDTIEEEIQYYAKKSTIIQKEAVIKLYEKNLSNQKLKQEILQILKN